MLQPSQRGHLKAFCNYEMHAYITQLNRIDRNQLCGLPKIFVDKSLNWVILCLWKFAKNGGCIQCWRTSIFQ